MTKSRDDHGDELSTITECLQNLDLSRVAYPENAAMSASENAPPEHQTSVENNKDELTRTYLPKKAMATTLPPRQDIRRVLDGGSNMASDIILQDSLKYYEKARRMYENRLALRDKILATSTSTPQIITFNGACPEEPEDTFLDNIGQIIKQINKLLSKKTYDYNLSWGSMIDELDLDEGFFITNLGKIHQGGELYEFLVATKRVLGEYRMMESYLMWSSEQLDDFGQTKFGKYWELKRKVNWNQLWYEIGEERKLLVNYTSEFEEYFQDIAEMRVLKSSGQPVETFLPPEKPYTPYIDDIISASNDTGITHEFLAKEILFLAEEATTGKNFIEYCLRTRDLGYLSLRFRVDLTALKVIFHGHADPERFFLTKRRIENFRRLLFVVDHNANYEGRQSWPIAALELFRIFELKSEQERLIQLEEFLDNPGRLEQLQGEVFEDQTDEEYSTDEEYAEGYVGAVVYSGEYSNATPGGAENDIDVDSDYDSVEAYTTPHSI